MKQLVVPLIMFSFALVQLIRVSYTDLSSWRGGGFGMYSDVHWSSSRVIWLNFKDHGRMYRVRLRDDNFMRTLGFEKDIFKEVACLVNPTLETCSFIKDIFLPDFGIYQKKNLKSMEVYEIRSDLEDKDLLSLIANRIKVIEYD